MWAAPVQGPPEGETKVHRDPGMPGPRANAFGEEREIWR